MNGQFRFVIFAANGIVVSDKALRDAPQAVEDLLGFPAKTASKVPINPPPDEAVELKV